MPAPFHSGTICGLEFLDCYKWEGTCVVGMAAVRSFPSTPLRQHLCYICQYCHTLSVRPTALATHNNCQDRKKKSSSNWPSYSCCKGLMSGGTESTHLLQWVDIKRYGIRSNTTSESTNNYHNYSYYKYRKNIRSTATPYPLHFMIYTL